MHHCLRLCTLLTIALLTLGGQATSAPKATNKQQPVPALIEANRNNKALLFNAPVYNNKAKVYYLYLLNNIYTSANFTQATDFLAELHNKMQPTGAELILCVNYTAKDAAQYAKSKRLGGAINIPRRCAQLAAKCPIVNTDKASVRDTLFKNHISPYGSPYTHSYPILRAIDPRGKALAYFMLCGKSVRMLLPDSRFSKLVVRNVQRESEWVADTILATHSYLLRIAEEAETEQPGPEDDEQATARTSIKKKGGRKSSPGKKQTPPADEPDADTPEEDEDDEEEWDEI